MKSKKEIRKEKRKSVNADLKQFDVIAKENSFIELTEWANTEGVDIIINNHTEKFISLSWGELKAIKNLSKNLLKN